MRLLMADGDEAFLEVAQRYLSRHGHEVNIATNGLESVAILRRYRPWYTRKREPSFADILMTLRRRTWQNILSRLYSRSTLDKLISPQLTDFLCRAA